MVEEKKVVFRNSESGHFVTPQYAKRNPETTEREVRPTHVNPSDRKVVLNRNSNDGRFVTPAYVKRNPETTEREVRRVPTPRTSTGRSTTRNSSR